ncbi:hypothetical protein A2631_04750 [Candidatus Daviesbacteria bacterium RIFCSPHIGHO2_01_FULL_44_29]|uniref:Hydrolase TatD n=1 Tax=Candidatus Daviesbacteria bacterium RIFCSPHIGHO2_02_FULL_43_12 TaxID=1797776 RepID=A0A1F5KGU1_9BACT|nr:MAG: hypothetical protein A2631_04750 [Candidatus Daviesbacteria bacterium RIFCSPHIGHO2_01_FULL_44_29]OGE40030.1 MAG: hypothetical protein A3D25_04480 [Candidatus Daviesbacteria bacterium RIFCSPHIGHO2_02_FULL_43_12]OGE41488.1 MAG: hypothetical protein A3E86_05330 [Candidatus Daviesbacteria bacterium RIFCSPHIGHO2_12_FULL_47_45]OGE70289.1 MAG: hypothetical protein A3B55_01090 [Candidatus Daviesbacteria bacterium RIFCSPLOWO2_01_FULL_43_15]
MNSYTVHKLTDSHAHLYFDKLRDQLDLVLENAVANGLGIIINVGVDVETSKEAVRQTIDFRLRGNDKESGNNSLKIYSTIGIHPHEGVNYPTKESEIQNDLEALKDLYLNNQSLVVGIGECGLDFFFEHNAGFVESGLIVEEKKKSQMRLFEAQIVLVNELQLPLIVHCRDAWTEMLPYLNQFNGVLHCYSGNTKITKQVLETNLYISFAGNITYPKNDWLRESLKMIPLERVLIETDSPFLAPQSKRGQPNEPANIREVAERVAQVKGISVEEVARQTTQNVIKVFNLNA